MLGMFLFFCVCLLLGVWSYFGFPVRVRFGCREKPETAIGQQQDEGTARSEDEAEASASDYEVFLSFRGPDTRQGIADVLYNDMVTAGIRVFRDDDEIDVGDQISAILPAINNSKICVPILSRNFAASAWCLREVERMVKLEKRIMPIFYTATPDDVKLGTELFEKDLKKHEKKHGREQVKKWKDALKAVGKIKGREVKSSGYAEFSSLFIKTLLIMLRVEMKHLADYLVKRVDQEESLMKLLETSSDDLRLIGIHGMGGIGKTTLAKVVFNRLSTSFDCCSFLENFEESLRRNGFEYLQKQLLEDLDPKLKHFPKIDPVRMLRGNFCRRKVLIVLDDVNQRKQVEVIVGMLGWFGSGSRIIITTRDKRVFTREEWIFEMQEMNNDQALQLFSRHAFGKDSPPIDFKFLSNEVLSLTGRIPLAIEVMGSRLHQCEKRIWKATIEKLKKVPSKDVKEKLKISFEALEYEEQQIFLDIACFFIYKDISSAIYMWEACEFFPDIGIDVLVSMSLVRTADGKFWMHHLIRDLGRELVREECFSDPALRSRIWSFKEASEVLKIKKGKKKVEGLFQDAPCCSSLKNEQFSSFRNLRLLKLVETKLVGDFEDLLPRLKWFSWHRCPADFYATNLSLRNLVVLDLSRSFITENWAGWSLIQMAKKLKVLDLTSCCNLTSTPDLSNNSTLERLILRDCRNLAEIHSSIGKLKRLKYLDLKGCPSLRGLPEEFGAVEDLEEILIDGSGETFNIPESIGNLRSLTVIRIHRVEVTKIPNSIRGLVNLTRLVLQDCTGIEKIPDAIGDLKSLVELDLSRTKVSVLPDSVGRLVKLKNLCLGSTEIGELPDSIGDLRSLYKLDLSCTRVGALPSSVGRLVKLRIMYLKSTKIEELPESLGELKLLEILDVCSSSLSCLPDSVGDLCELRWLNMDECKVRKVPSCIKKLTKLETLSAGTCDFPTEIPKEIENLPALRELWLRGSCIPEVHRENLPDLDWPVLSAPLSLDALTRLSKLNINCTGLKSVPQLPSTLSLLSLSYATSRTKLPDFSNLENLSTIVLEHCSLKDVHEMKSLGALKSLTNAIVRDCTDQMVDFCSQLENLAGLAISESKSSWTLLDLSRLRNLTLLELVSCKGLAEIRGLGNLVFFVNVEISDCQSLQTMRNFSGLKRLGNITIRDCSKLREIEGLDKSFLVSIHIDGCESVKNLEELKKRCQWGYFNGLEVENYSQIEDCI